MLVIIASGELIHHRTNTLFSAGTNLTINARVDSLFTPISHGFHGLAVVRSINGQEIDYFSRPKIVLISPIPLELNSNVEAKVKLKPVIGVLNPLGFDREKWAISQQIIGQASIKSNHPIVIRSYSSWREHLYRQAVNLTQERHHQGLLLALGFGERSLIDNQQWQRLQQSGLNHLVAISGLHIGIAFGFGWLLGFQAIRCGLRNTTLPLMLATLFAVGYAWLSGFSLPTQRALILLAILIVFRFGQIHSPYRYKWLLMVAALLLYNPFAVYSLSFWLSIYAVGTVFICLSVIPKHASRLKQALVSQMALVVLISPLIILLFHGLGWASLLYNLVFVPWFSLLLIPMTLAAIALLPFNLSLSGDLFTVVDFGLYPLTYSIAWSDNFWWSIPQTYAWPLLFGLVLLLLFRLLKTNGFLLVLLSVLLLLPNRREAGIWRLMMFDVGHGLAVVIEKQGKAVLYDTGSGWDNSSYVEQVLIPYFNYKNVHLDLAIISHFDNDHAGGLNHLMRWNPELSVVSSQLSNLSVSQGQDCQVGQMWQWQGLNFEVLWPPRKVTRAYNPHSCVLKISDQQQRSVLLTGDIDAVAEWLLLRDSKSLNNNVVLVPHHGSRSSSRRAFIQAVNADVALVSSAYQGRWNLPAPQVKQRYLEEGAKWFDTGQEGQITVTFTPDAMDITTMRSSKGQAWYRQMLRNRVE